MALSFVIPKSINCQICDKDVLFTDLINHSCAFTADCYHILTNNSGTPNTDEEITDILLTIKITLDNQQQNQLNILSRNGDFVPIIIKKKVDEEVDNIQQPTNDLFKKKIITRPNEALPIENLDRKTTKIINNHNIPVSSSKRNDKVINVHTENIQSINDSCVIKTSKTFSNNKPQNGRMSAISGFQNLGNSCFMNSVLVMIFHIPQIQTWMLENSNHSRHLVREKETPCFICIVSKTLRACINHSRKVVKPSTLYSSMSHLSTVFIPNHEHDAHEFLSKLISRFDDEVQMRNNLLRNVLSGTYINKIQCKQNHVSQTIEKFMEIPLAFTEVESLNDALDLYFYEEVLNDYKCKYCNMFTSAVKYLSIDKAPEILCIQLQRFDNNNRKIYKNVQYEEYIDLTNYLKVKDRKLVYELISLIEHIGSSTAHGHYICVVKNSENDFLFYDDNSVPTIIETPEVLSKTPYILMYKRVNNAPLVTLPITPHNSKKDENFDIGNILDDYNSDLSEHNSIYNNSIDSENIRYKSLRPQLSKSSISRLETSNLRIKNKIIEKDKNCMDNSIEETNACSDIIDFTPLEVDSTKDLKKPVCSIEYDSNDKYLSQEVVHKIIQAVQRRPVIYNFKRNYGPNKRQLVNAAWSEIEAELKPYQITGEQARRRWKSLYDYYIKLTNARMKILNSSGIATPTSKTNPKKPPEWHYERSLHFLKELMPTTKHTSNVPHGQNMNGSYHDEPIMKKRKKSSDNNDAINNQLMEKLIETMKQPVTIVCDTFTPRTSSNIFEQLLLVAKSLNQYSGPERSSLIRFFHENLDDYSEEDKGKNGKSVTSKSNKNIYDEFIMANGNAYDEDVNDNSLLVQEDSDFLINDYPDV